MELSSFLWGALILGATACIYIISRNASPRQNNSKQATIGNESPFSEQWIADGNLFFEKGEFVEAEKCYLAALPVLEEVLGKEHLAVVEIQHKLEIIAKQAGNPSKEGQ